MLQVKSRSLQRLVHSAVFAAVAGALAHFPGKFGPGGHFEDCNS